MHNTTHLWSGRAEYLFTNCVSEFEKNICPFLRRFRNPVHLQTTVAGSQCGASENKNITLNESVPFISIHRRNHFVHVFPFSFPYRAGLYIFHKPFQETWRFYTLGTVFQFKSISDWLCLHFYFFSYGRIEYIVFLYPCLAIIIMIMYTGKILLEAITPRPICHP